MTDQVIEELKPCPFCGTRAQAVVFGKGQANERHGVRCADLTCGGMVRLGTKPGESAELWNARTDPDKRLREALKQCHEALRIARKCLWANHYSDGSEPMKKIDAALSRKEVDE